MENVWRQYVFSSFFKKFLPDARCTVDKNTHTHTSPERGKKGRKDGQRLCFIVFSETYLLWLAPFWFIICLTTVNFILLQFENHNIQITGKSKIRCLVFLNELFSFEPDSLFFRSSLDSCSFEDTRKSDFLIFSSSFSFTKSLNLAPNSAPFTPFYG